MSEHDELAFDLLRAKHPDNPDAPLPMVRAGCAAPLAAALYDLGWRQTVFTEREAGRPRE